MWYNILKVGSNASKEEIENAYRKLSQDPKIMNDMNKSYQVRQAYFEGLKQATNDSFSLNSSSDNNMLNSQNITSGEHNTFNNDNNKSNSTKSILTILIIVFVVVLIILGTIFVSVFVNVTEDDLKDEIKFDSELLTCIANDTNNNKVEISHPDFNKELRDNGYKTEDVSRYEYIAYKPIDDYMIIIEVNKQEELKCDISINYEVDATEIMEEEHTTSLIGTISLGYNFFETEQREHRYYNYKIYYHTSYPVSSIVEVAYDFLYLNVDGTIELATFSADNDEDLEKYTELITVEQFYEMNEILSDEIDKYR